MLGVVSFFADFTYEGSRAITGPFLEVLGANGTIVGIVAGLGELLGYGLRFFSGRASERTRQFWPITFFGYIIQMAAVPLLALAGSWRLAAILILLERIGKAIRNPPRDVMLAHAAKEMGFGWGFGVHEALDQFGALFGPLLVTLVLVHHGNYRLAFSLLLIPSVITLSLLGVARFLYPQPEGLKPSVQDMYSAGLPRSFWIYLVAAGLVAAGFADFQLIAFHWKQASIVPTAWVPFFYSEAMAVSGLGSLVFGRLFDRFGISVLIPLTLISTAFAPLVFWGGPNLAFAGSALWGIGMGVHESIIPAAVATMVPPNRRPSAYGIFTGSYGVAWFLGSAVMGILYDRSITGVVLFCMVVQLAAIPLLLHLRKAMATRT
jgi:MFS family permease